MAKLTGAAIMARALKDQGVDYMFGIVGFPVQPIAREAQKAGIKYYGCRNEQAASYAAGAVGYLTGRPGACLVVSGPGVVHGLAGLSNAKENCWPMILIGGASPVKQNGMGAFQEERQVLIATHSPVALNMLEPGQVLCFAKDKTGATDIVAGDRHPALQHWKQGQPDLGVMFASGILS